MSQLRLCSFVLCLFAIDFASAGGAGNVTEDADGFAPTWVKEPDGRGTWKIVYSTVFTMILCAWTSLHLNIPPSNETWPATIKRNLLWVFFSFLFPEYIVFLAAVQWFQVRELQRKLSAKTTDPKMQRHYPQLKPVSTLYSWFVIMGGIRVHTSRMHNTLSLGTLSSDGVLFLADHGALLHVGDEEIIDRSKADYLAKALVIFQVLWFTADVIQRKVARLPLSLAEFHTIVNVGCWLITYSLWFGKPLNIKSPALFGTDESSNLAELIAVMLFRTRRKPLTFDVEAGTQEVKRIPAEMEMWSWLNAETMVVSSAVRDISWKYRDAHLLRVCPANNEPAVRTVEEGDLLEGSLPGESQDVSRHPRFKLSLSQKDEVRLALVQGYYGSRQQAQSGGQESIHSTTSNGEARVIAETNSAGAVPGCSSSSLPEQGRRPSPQEVPGHRAASVDLEMQASSRRAGTYPCTYGPYKECRLRYHRQEHITCPINHLSYHVPKYGIVRTRAYFPDIVDACTYFAIRWQDTPKDRRGLTFAPFLIFIIPAAYGALHLIADSAAFTFPTATERLLWKICCYLAMMPSVVVTVVIPAIIIFKISHRMGRDVLSRCIPSREERKRGRPRQRKSRAVFREREEREPPPPWRKSKNLVTLFLVLVYFLLFLLLVLGVVLALFLASRMYFMVEAFISLRRAKGDVFRTPKWHWMDKIPHV